MKKTILLWAAAAGFLGGQTPTSDFTGTVRGINGVTLSTLGSGIYKFDANGVPSLAVPGTDYLVNIPSTTPIGGDVTGTLSANVARGINGVTLSTLGAGIYKFNTSGVPSLATPGADYLATMPSDLSGYVNGINGVVLTTLGAGIYKFNASGVPSLAVPGTDYLVNVPSTTPLSGDVGGTLGANVVHGISGVTLATLGAGIYKFNSSGVPSLAVAGVDYLGSFPTAAQVGLGNVQNVDTTNASNIISGTLPVAQTAALSGDVSKGAGSAVTSIGTGRVTAAMLAGSIPASKLVGTDLTISPSQIDGSTGPLLFTLATSDYRSLVKATTVGHGAFNWAVDDSATFTGIHDPAMFVGYNIQAGGARENPAEPSLHIAIEADFNSTPTGPRLMEYHLQYQGTGGDVRRPYGFIVDRGTGAIQHGFRGNSVVWYDDSGNPWMQFNNANNLSLYASGTYISKQTNNQQWLQQLNAPATAFVNLIYLNGSDNVVVGGNNVLGILLQTSNATRLSIDAAGGIKFGAIKSTTGSRTLCVDSAGNMTAVAGACPSGT